MKGLVRSARGKLKDADALLSEGSFDGALSATERTRTTRRKVLEDLEEIAECVLGIEEAVKPRDSGN